MQTYKIVRSKRKTISMKVVNKQLIVYAPLLCPNSLIEQFVSKHQNWIEKKLSATKKILSLDLANLNEVYILGRKYQLDISTANKSAIYLSGDTLFICGKSTNAVNNCFKKYLEGIITDEIIFIQKDKNISFDYSFRYYKSRWGCCYKNKQLIIINSLAACLEKQLLDSIIFHEIAHLSISNHQKEFYDCLAKLDSNYRNNSKALKEYEIM